MKKSPTPSEAGRHTETSFSSVSSRPPTRKPDSRTDACRCGPGQPSGSDPHCPACNYFAAVIRRVEVRRLIWRCLGA